MFPSHDTQIAIVTDSGKITLSTIGTHYDNNPDVIKALENTGTTGIKV